jgi:hypothetical protein
MQPSTASLARAGSWSTCLRREPPTESSLCRRFSSSPCDRCNVSIGCPFGSGLLCALISPIPFRRVQSRLAGIGQDRQSSRERNMSGRCPRKNRRTRTEACLRYSVPSDQRHAALHRRGIHDEASWHEIGSAQMVLHGAIPSVNRDPTPTNSTKSENPCYPLYWRPGGGGWIRTNVGVRQRIYSPSPLATRAPLHRAGYGRTVRLSTNLFPARPTLCLRGRPRYRAR